MRQGAEIGFNNALLGDELGGEELRALEKCLLSTFVSGESLVGRMRGCER